MWEPLIERLRRPVFAADMPGFGRSARPDRSAFDGSVGALTGWAEALIEALEVERYDLVCHDWGSVGLVAASRRPEQVRRLVAFNTVPYESDYRWHWIAQIWRRRGAGELLARAPGRSRLVGKTVLRQARPGFRAMPPQFLADAFGSWDAGTAAAILRLYRSADTNLLARLGQDISAITAPARVFWGTRDPYIRSRFGARLAERLPAATLTELDDAGHWPWIDRPDLVDQTARFLAG